MLGSCDVLMCPSSRLGDGESLLASSLGGSLSARKSILVMNALDAVGRVDVLDKGNLEAGGSALARGNGRVSEEVLPDLVKRVS